MFYKTVILTTVVTGVLGASAAAAQTAGTPGSVAGPTAQPSSAAAPLQLEVSLAERRLYVRQGESVLAEYPVAVGKPEHPTPAGEFRIRRIIWNPRWVPPRAGWARGKKAKEPGDPENPMGRVKMFFREPDYYIHGTNNEASLGQAASHGCVRMANRDVMELARLVMEHGGEPRPPSWFERIRDLFRSTEEVRLSDPVSLRIRA